MGSLAMFLLVGGFFVVLHSATGTESLLAPGYDLSWRLVDSGHVERHGLTRKTSKFRIYERPRVILLPGETLEIDYAFEGEHGAASEGSCSWRSSWPSWRSRFSGAGWGEGADGAVTRFR